MWALLDLIVPTFCLFAGFLLGCFVTSRWYEKTLR